MKEAAKSCAEKDIQQLKELEKKGYTKEQIDFYFKRLDFHLKKLIEKLKRTDEG